MEDIKKEFETSGSESNLGEGRNGRGRVRVYISSTINAQSRITNKRAAEVLQDSDLFEVCLPQESIPAIHHAELERWAPRYCERYIDWADIILLLMDTYGIDCSWEVGRAHKFKPVVAYVEQQANFEMHRQDWMVKYSISCVITANPAISRMCKKDKMFRQIPVYRVKDIQELPRQMLAFYRWKLSQAGQEMMILGF
jgi:nucleoside 2-deoxyribosyltransferase